MKISIALGSFLPFIYITSAHADNINIENAIKNQPDLSTFYQLLVDTGVNHELQAHASYTIFAPTNNAFVLIHPVKGSCLNAPECRVQVAQIVRNHIVSGTIYMDDAVKQQGGLFSMSGLFINLGQPNLKIYAVDGKDIIYSSCFGDGMLYKIDGVIASPLELASISLPGRTEVNTTEKTIPDPACGSGGCPDSKTQTTTTTRTIIRPPAVYSPILAPAAR